MENLIKIFEVFREEAVKIASAPDDPHNHDFEELLIGTEGGLEHFIDFKSEVIEAPYISFVTKGKVHRLIPRSSMKNAMCVAYVLKASLYPKPLFISIPYFTIMPI